MKRNDDDESEWILNHSTIFFVHEFSFVGFPSISIVLKHAWNIALSHFKDARKVTKNRYCIVLT